MTRVVITGMGVVSPNGIGKDAFARSVLEGRSGIKRISRFDPTGLPVHIAGEIPEFDELMDKAQSQAPTRSLVSIDDVGRATAFLALDGAKLITGGVTYVDGGYHIVD